MVGSIAQPGIIPMVVKHCFSLLQKRDDASAITVKVSYIEIYNEDCRDLLSNESQSIHIYDTSSGVELKGLHEVEIFEEQGALDLIASGEVKRMVGTTGANSRSSRSHAVFRISILYAGEVYSTLSLVDLAGAESARETNTVGKRQQEGNFINKSLTTLGVIIRKLSDNATSNEPADKHIPYRDSKLTRILKQSLSGRAKLCIICTLSNSSTDEVGLKSTLHFASRAKNVKQISTLTTFSNEGNEIRKCLKEISDLRGTVQKLENELQRERKMVTELQKTSQLREQTSRNISNGDMECLVRASTSLRQLLSSNIPYTHIVSPCEKVNFHNNVEQSRDDNSYSTAHNSSTVEMALELLMLVIERNKKSVERLTNDLISSCPAELFVIDHKPEDTINDSIRKMEIEREPAENPLKSKDVNSAHVIEHPLSLEEHSAHLIESNDRFADLDEEAKEQMIETFLINQRYDFDDNLIYELHLPTKSSIVDTFVFPKGIFVIFVLPYISIVLKIQLLAMVVSDIYSFSKAGDKSKTLRNISKALLVAATLNYVFAFVQLMTFLSLLSMAVSSGSSLFFVLLFDYHLYL